MISALILAAGRGTRMKSDLPKVLHPLAGLPLIAYPLKLCKKLNIKPVTLIVSKESGSVKEYVESRFPAGIQFAVQNPPLGTGHAVQTGLKKNKNPDGDILILYGDMPLIRPETIQALIRLHEEERAILSFVTAVTGLPTAFGRVLRDKNQVPVRIVEDKDATLELKAIQELNVGIYLVAGEFLFRALKQIQPENAQKEYYLTDIIRLAHEFGAPIATLPLSDFTEAMGINTLRELAEAERVVLAGHRQRLMAEGVRMIQPASITLDSQVEVGRGSVLFGPCHLLGKTRIGQNCMIEPGAFIRDSVLDDSVTVKASSYLDGARVAHNSQIGPFAHLRPQAEIGPEVKIGNFVEIKKSRIARGSKVNHLSYIGDADIGKAVNVGAGTITCNYDGVHKHKTVLEDGVFVGSDTQFVAPVRVGKGAVIGAGSTITKNVKPHSLALSRAEQKEIKGWAKRRPYNPKL